MANNKVGFNYYNIDTDRYLDIRIKRLKKNFGCSGIAIYDYILCEVYRVKGCFLQWDESTAFDVADYFGIKESLVNEVVNYCGVVGLFNKELLSDGNIITSLSIQRRAIEMSKRAKRNDFKIPKKIKLTEESDIITEESDIIPEESTETQEGCRKERKKEKKETLSTREEILINDYNLSHDELLSEFLQSELWQQTLVMTDEKFKSVENVKRLMKEFCTVLKKADQFPIGLKEAKNRFAGWSDKQKTTENGNRLSEEF